MFCPLRTQYYGHYFVPAAWMYVINSYPHPLDQHTSFQIFHTLVFRNQNANVGGIGQAGVLGVGLIFLIAETLAILTVLSFRYGKNECTRIETDLCFSF